METAKQNQAGIPGNGDRHVLVTRMGVDCRNLTRDEFISMVSADIETAAKSYAEAIAPELKIRNDRLMARQRAIAMDEARKLYTSEKRRAKYVEAFLEQYRDYYKMSPLKSFSVNFGDGSDFTQVILGGQPTTLENAFRRSCKGNPHWETAKGWRLGYVSKSGSTLRLSSFIELINE